MIELIVLICACFLMAASFFLDPEVANIVATIAGLMACYSVVMVIVGTYHTSDW